MKILLLALCATLLTSQVVDAADAIRESVVRLQVTQRAPHLSKPWTKASPKKVTGSGALIEGGQILTNAHVVEHASQVFVQLRQGGDLLVAHVVAIAPRIDLAIVQLEDPSAMEDIAPLEITEELPTIKSTVNVYGYPLGGEDLSVTEGIVSRIEFAKYNYDGMGLRIQVDAALNSGNSGGPAIQDGKVVGLVFSGIKEAENIGYLIPAEEIKTFLEDIADGDYSGKMFLLDQIATAENDALRDYLKLGPQDTGIVVTKPYRQAEDYPLSRWDVITHIGPHSIDNQGYVDAGEQLRLQFVYFVNQLQENGNIGLTIRRQGKELHVQVPVSSSRELLLPLLRNEYPQYFIYGPFVFTTGTQEYLKMLGPKGCVYLSYFKSPLIKRQFDPPAFPGEEIVFIAAKTFPHRIMKGYGQMSFGVVERVNGIEVKNLRHFAEQLQESTEEFIELSMAGKIESLVFRRSELQASTEEILSNEGIRYQSSEELRDIWE